MVALHLPAIATRWVNEGHWEGQQLVDRDHILEGRQFPSYNDDMSYGYNVWLGEHLLLLLLLLSPFKSILTRYWLKILGNSWAPPTTSIRRWIYGLSFPTLCRSGTDTLCEQTTTKVHAFIGVDDQTAIISKEHEAVIVSMGGQASFGYLAWTAWANTKYAIVSNTTATVPLQ